MQGTMHVRSLIRLFIGAALLSLAWVVLTSGQASAAERSHPSQSSADRARAVLPVNQGRLETVLDGILGPSPTPADRAAEHPATPTKPAKAPQEAGAAKPATRHTPSATRRAGPGGSPASGVARRNENPSGATTSAIVPLVVEVAHGLVEEPVADLASSVDGGLALVADVTTVVESVPVVGAPLAPVTDAVAALVQSLPTVGIPSPLVPLPVGGGMPVVVHPQPGATEDVAAEADPASTDAVPLARVPDRHRFPAGDLATATEPSSVRVGQSTGPHGHHQPVAPGSPLGPAPALPSQPTPSGGSAQGASDPATVSAYVALPAHSMFGRTGADWRVPRGLPAHPGTRPD